MAPHGCKLAPIKCCYQSNSSRSSGCCPPYVQDACCLSVNITIVSRPEVLPRGLIERTNGWLIHSSLIHQHTNMATKGLWSDIRRLNIREQDCRLVRLRETDSSGLKLERKHVSSIEQLEDNENHIPAQIYVSLKRGRR